MFKLFYFIIIAATLLIMGLISTQFDIKKYSNIPIPSPSENQIVINNTKIILEIADTPEKQSQGLSGRKELQDGDGMLFPYDPPQQVSFWMKDMFIPIDIIFIKDSKVTNLYQNAQPEPGVALDRLKRYPSNGPIDYVLEVPAGYSNKYNIITGSPAIYIPKPDRS